MRKLFTFVVACAAVVVQDAHLAQAQGQGFALAPGETLVSINGVAVQQAAASSPMPVTQFAAPTTQTVQRASYTAPARSGGGLAQQKANRMASSGRMAHLGGGFGGGRAEGVGMGSSRQAAIQNCCYWGQRTPLEIGAATNGRMWFACVIYR